MNRKLKTIIIDDEEMATKVIESHLSHIPEIEIVGIYHSGVEAFLAFDQLEIDLMFLDIQMPKMTGLSMLKKIKNPPLTVLTTAHRDYALEGFDLDVVDYLLKPIGLDRFLQTITKIRRLVDLSGQIGELDQSEEELDHLFIKANRNFVKIYFQDIVYVEAVKNHCKIVTTNTSFISLISLSDFFDKLPPNDFLRIHRSYIIATAHIHTFNGNNVTLYEQLLPIGRSYKDTVKKMLEERLR